MTMTDDTNPRAGIGGNNPPLARSIAAEENFAGTVTTFLDDEYRAQPKSVEELLAEARALPKEIEDDAMKGKFTSLIKRLRDKAKELDSHHGKESTPYLRGKQAVDQFFFGLIDKCARRDKKNNPGAADVLMQRLNAYDQRKLAEEQARRDEEARKAAAAARAAAEEEARLAREAEEAAAAAERARAPAKVEEKTAAAEEKAAQATAARVEATVAANQAQEARVASFARPAEIMRHRSDEGTLSTMAQESYAEVEDDTKLDKEKLWPFIKLEAKEQALRAWAKTTGHGQQMTGAAIGKRPKSVVR